MGGIAALIEAALYITGFALFLTVLDPSGYDGHVQKVAFLADNQVASYIANLLIYVVFGVVLVVLVLALHARLKKGSPAIMQTATAFGLIWAGLVIASGMIANIGNSTVVGLFSENQDQAVALWLAIVTVQEALGGGNEIVGGLWVLLLSWAALSAGKLPKVLNYIGVLVGLAGILTVVPAFDVLMDVFGLGQIVWFAWLGIVMLRENPSAT
ncbi:MAG: DUF4386 family protein [Woeseiaceae bacterium]|nr:DUF4386 family protein [Woeseiaceae bacterium]